MSVVAATETFTVRFNGQKRQIAQTLGLLVDGHPFCGKQGEPTLRVRSKRWGWFLECVLCREQYV